jgi:hypothetical protein
MLALTSSGCIKMLVTEDLAFHLLIYPVCTQIEHKNTWYSSIDDLNVRNKLSASFHK